MYAVKCKDAEILSVFSHHFVFSEFINVTLSALTVKNTAKNKHSLVFAWKESNLEEICVVLALLSNQLQFVDFAVNSLAQIEKGCLKDKPKLTMLILHNNKLESIQPLAFTGLQKLIMLDLSRNNLAELTSSAISSSNIFGMCVLNISLNVFTLIFPQIKSWINVEMIVTEDYRICCLFKSTDIACSTEPKWPQTCNSLLESKTIKIFCVVEGLLVMVLNIVALFRGAVVFFQSNQFGHPKGPVGKPQSAQSAFLLKTMFLNFNDMLFGWFSFLVFIADANFADNYVVFAHVWLGSINCKTLGTISVFMMANSLFLLCLVSVARLIAVKYPFNVHFKSVKTVIKYLSTCFCSSVLFSFILLCSYIFSERRDLMPSSTCLFVGGALKSVTVQCTAIVFALLQTGMCLSVGVMYFLILKENKKSAAVRAQNTKDKEKDRQLLYQALLVVGTNVVCWLPSSAIYLASVTMETYPLTLLTWNVVLINPINSLVNPIVFCVIPKLKELFEKKNK